MKVDLSQPGVSSSEKDEEEEERKTERQKTNTLDVIQR